MRGGVSLSTEGGVWKKGCASSPETFSILSSKRRVLVHSDRTDKTYFLSAWRLDFFGQPPSRGGGAIAPLAPPVDPSLS